MYVLLLQSQTVQFKSIRNRYTWFGSFLTRSNSGVSVRAASRLSATIRPLLLLGCPWTYLFVVVGAADVVVVVDAADVTEHECDLVFVGSGLDFVLFW